MNEHGYYRSLIVNYKIRVSANKNIYLWSSNLTCMSLKISVTFKHDHHHAGNTFARDHVNPRGHKTNDNN